MSIDRDSSSCGARQSPALPPFLHLAIPQENDALPDRREGSNLTVKKFNRALHSVIFSKRMGTVDRLEKVAEAAVEGEDVDVEYPSVSSYSTKLRKKASLSSHSTKLRKNGPPVSRRPSIGSSMSQSTSSHFPAIPQSPHTLITSLPLLNVADIPPKSPTNKSPFSAVLLSEEGEEGEDDPALALWCTDQVHRARLAKLTRHFGEEIPADLVMSPTFLSRGASTCSVRPRRGERSHHRRRSLDPSAFLQNPSVADPRETILRRSRSLKGRDDTIPPMPTAFPSELAADARDTEKEKGCSTDASKNTETGHGAVPNTYVTPPRPKLPENVLDDQALPRDRAPMETYPDSLASPPTRPSVETYSETSHSSLRRSPRARTLSRRPATADSSRRMEKLANFFGVDHNDLSGVSQLHGAAQKFQFSSVSAAGDLAIGVHATSPQLEADVKVIKPNRRFWNLVDGGVATTARPEDVMNKLRTMRAS